MTEIEPISDADLAAICAALDGLPETSERPYRGMIARIRRAEALIDGMASEIVDASDYLARALGYPLDPDESGVPAGPHYCVGEHTIASLADEAARQLAALQAERAPRSMDTAPKDGTSILVLFRGRLHVAQYAAILHPDYLRWSVPKPATGLSDRTETVDDISPQTIDGHRIPGTHAGPEAWWPLPALPTEETDPNG